MKKNEKMKKIPPPPVFFLLGEVMQCRYAKSH